MEIIEIKPLENGGHRNQVCSLPAPPDGWAVIPEDMKKPDTFPFVTLEVDGDIVTGMEAGTVPEAPEPQKPDKTDAERIAELEQQLADMDETLVALYEMQGG